MGGWVYGNSSCLWGGGWQAGTRLNWSFPPPHLFLITPLPGLIASHISSKISAKLWSCLYVCVCVSACVCVSVCMCICLFCACVHVCEWMKS